MRGVGHLIHDSVTHRDQYLAELDRFLGTYAPLCEPSESSSERTTRQ